MALSMPVSMKAMVWPCPVIPAAQASGARTCWEDCARLRRSFRFSVMLATSGSAASFASSAGDTSSAMNGRVE